MTDEWIENSNVPDVPGLELRSFRGESDFTAIAEVLTGSAHADGIQRNVKAEDVANIFTNYLTNCDPSTDLIFAEISGEVVGYSRCWWSEEGHDTRLYQHNGFLLPEWRRMGIGRAMLDWLEDRLVAIAKAHPIKAEKFFQVNLEQEQKGATVMLERAGYQPVRSFYQMVRPNLDNLPDFPLPDGLEVRPARKEDYPAIWSFIDETSKDEWGYAEPTEAMYQEWLEGENFQPHLWQVAWDRETNQIAGTVLTYIYHEENKQFNRKRGYTEGIAVAFPWRRRGVARALISLSLQAQKSAGMAESALVADSDNPNGLKNLYGSCGFEVVSCDTVYRKKLRS